MPNPVVVSVASMQTQTDSPLREAHLEALLGTLLRDVDGRKLGRIEEFIAEQRGTDLVLVEVHLGKGALLERLGELVTVLPMIDKVERRLQRRIRVRWDQLDLSDIDNPRVTVRREDLVES